MHNDHATESGEKEIINILSVISSRLRVIMHAIFRIEDSIPPSENDWDAEY